MLRSFASASRRAVFKVHAVHWVSSPRWFAVAANPITCITMADASLLDPELRSWLADLDPSQNLLACAESNLRELRNNPFADQIAAATLLASLAPVRKRSR
jgi:hypothetical protein